VITLQFDNRRRRCGGGDGTAVTSSRGRRYHSNARPFPPRHTRVRPYHVPVLVVVSCISVFVLYYSRRLRRSSLCPPRPFVSFAASATAAPAAICEATELLSRVPTRPHAHSNTHPHVRHVLGGHRCVRSRPTSDRSALGPVHRCGTTDEPVASSPSPRESAAMAVEVSVTLSRPEMPSGLGFSLLSVAD